MEKNSRKIKITLKDDEFRVVTLCKVSSDLCGLFCTN